jgi:predicted transposase/invertase (TIGR01784 family)
MFLDPKNDVAFRKIFGTEKNRDILIHFLNDVLTFKNGYPIQDVTFLKPIQDPDTLAQKTSIVDVLCKDEKGSSYIVQMQVAKIKDFEKRAQRYASKAYSSQANVGNEYENLKEIVFLVIADFTMFPDKQGYKSEHVILDKESYEHDLKDFSFTFIELPKFKKEVDKLSNIQEKWCYFFKHAKETSLEDLKKVIGNDAVIERAYSELDQFGWNTDELLKYEQSEKNRKDYLSSLAQKFDEGKVEGRVEGEAIGEARGEAKGRAEGEAIGEARGEARGKTKGRAEGIMDTAKKLLEQGVSIAIIQSATGLAEDEIMALMSVSEKD